MNWNAHILVRKLGHKYELEICTWTKHHNFKQMYDCIKDALIKSVLEEALDVPIFMVNDVNEVSENDKARLGMEVCTHITHPQLFIVVDKVG